jgi:hypothetical protein
MKGRTDEDITAEIRRRIVEMQCEIRERAGRRPFECEGA